MQFAQEFLDDVRGEIEPLFEAHWQEIALNQGQIALEPNWTAYAALEGAGHLRIFTAREGGELVGYFFLILAGSLHYRSHEFAVTDLIYLAPAHRRGLAGLRFIKFGEQCLRADGASMMIVNVKNHASFGPVMERAGFSPIETLYSKVLL